MKFVLAGLFVIGFVMICYSVVKMQFTNNQFMKDDE